MDSRWLGHGALSPGHLGVEGSLRTRPNQPVFTIDRYGQLQQPVSVSQPGSVTPRQLK